MKAKLLNIGLILTSLIGYLEWGTDQSMFLFQGEWDVLTKLFTDPGSVIHPFTILPMLGQILLIITLFQKKPNKWLTYIGMGLIAILLVFIFAIGLMQFQVKIFGSIIPFLVIGVLTIWYHRKGKDKKPEPL